MSKKNYESPLMWYEMLVFNAIMMSPGEDINPDGNSGKWTEDYQLTPME